MAPLPTTDKELLRAVALYKKHGSQQGAANALGITRPTVQHRLREAVRRGLVKPSDTASHHPWTSKASSRVATARDNIPRPAPVPPADHVDIRRLRDQLDSVRKERDTAVRRALAAEDLRGGILDLPPPVISTIQPRHAIKSGHGVRSVILHLSDLQYAETIDLDEMDGVNSYSVEIANRRLQRTFSMLCDLLTEHWKGKPPETLYLCLGGDMVSGGIHPELAKTDGLLRLPSAKEVAAQIVAGIRLVRSRVGCKVAVLSVPGNHGRLTIKPESKSVAVDSLDTLVTWFAEAAMKPDKGVSFLYGESIDCLFSVYGYNFLLTHGDKAGSKGGQGFLGAVATILRGHFKLHADYADRGVILYRILTGHYHTTCRLPLGYGNGSLPGWSDYARDLRARKEGASQNMLVVHNEHGIIEFREIKSGVPNEGSLYT